MKRRPPQPRARVRRQHRRYRKLGFEVCEQRLVLANPAVEFGLNGDGSLGNITNPHTGSTTPFNQSDPGGSVNRAVAGAGVDPVMRVITRFFARPANYPFDGGGDRVLATNEIDSIGVGQDFVVKLLVEDIHSMGTREGVVSAYVDVNFDGALATVVPTLPGVVHPQTQNPTPFLHDRVYGEQAEPSVGDGLTDTNGDNILDQIDLIGSFSSNLSGAGAGEFVLVEWAMTAILPGTLTMIAEPTTENPAVDPNDAGESPLFDAGIFGQDAPVCPSQSVQECMGDIEFISDSITIVDRIAAVSDTINLTEGDPPQTIDVLANDINNTTVTPTISSTTQGSLGSVTNNGSNVTYIPNDRDVAGTDTFSYAISNGLGDSSSANVTVNIEPVNDPPINRVPGDPLLVDEDDTLDFADVNVISVDDIDAGAGDVKVALTVGNGILNVVPTSGGGTVTNNGTASVSIDGTVSQVNNSLSSLTYSPNLNFNGSTDQLSVNTNDNGNTGGNPLSDTDIVNITIQPINDAPVLNPTGTEMLTGTDEDTTSPAVTVADVVGDTITDVDPGALTGIAITDVTGNGGWEFSTDGGETFMPLVSLTDALAVLLRGQDLLRYVPDQQNGEIATVTYRTWDQTGATAGQEGATADTTSNGGATPFSVDLGTASMVVTDVNDPPVARNDTYSTNEDTILIVGTDTGLLANDTDVDGDPLNVADFDAVSTFGAAVSVNPDGSFTYDPTGAAELQALSAGQARVDKFIYRVSDVSTSGDTDTGGPVIGGTVTIAVSGVNDPPSAVADSYSTGEDTALDVRAGAGLLSNLSDPEGDSITAVPFSGTSDLGAAVTVNSDGSFTYDPRGSATLQALGQGDSATDGIPYTVTDGNGGSATATVNIEVFGRDENAVGQNAANPCDVNNDGEANTVDLLELIEFLRTTGPGPATAGAPFRDVDGDGQVNSDDSALLARALSNPTADKNVTNITSPSPFEVIQTLNRGQTLNVEVTADVNPVDLNLPPGTTLTITELNNQAVSVGASVTTPEGGTIELTGGSSITYTPASNFLGLDLIIGQYETLPNPGDGPALITFAIQVLGDLTVSLTDLSIPEFGGSTTGTVTRDPVSDEDLNVILTSSNNDEATVPESVIIPANQPSATFTITAVDDALLDGSQTVTITASGSGFSDGTATVNVTDHETLTVAINPTSIPEDGSATGTVTRSNTDNDQPLVVNLTSDDATQATIPQTLTIAGGDASATFNITGVDDTLRDGPQMVTVTASADGYTINGTATVTIADDDSASGPVISSSASGSEDVSQGSTSTGGILVPTSINSNVPIVSLTAIITGGGLPEDGLFSTPRNGSGITNNFYDPATMSLTLTGEALLTDYVTVLNRLGYFNNNNPGEHTPHTLTVDVFVTDANGEESNRLTFTVNVLPASLVAADAAPLFENVTNLSSPQLDAIVSAAVTRWTDTGLSAAHVALLQSASFRISDLPDDLLGTASLAARTITLDAGAAGRGWFVDPTPDDDLEFDSAAASPDRIDLLTAVMHELGHLLGLADVPAGRAGDDLMSDELSAGTRRLPTAAPIGMTNPLDRFDVNGDGFRTAIDALLLINELNRRTDPSAVGEQGPPIGFWDVNGDKKFSPLDVLHVINVLNGDTFTSQAAAPSVLLRATTSGSPLTNPTDHSLRVADGHDGDLALPASHDEASQGQAPGASQASPQQQADGLAPDGDLLDLLAEDRNSL